jgi:hypothetical protein
MPMPRRLAAAILTSITLLLPAGLSAAILPPGGKLDFTVLRNGSPIGSHVLTFADQGGRIDVAIRTDIAVKLPLVGIALYRFEHEGSEVWDNGRLVRLNSKTNDNGTPKHVSAAAAGPGLRVDGSAKQWQTPGLVIPASLWNPHLVQQPALLNTLDGSRMAISVRFTGEENVQVHGKPVKAKHYVIDGALKRQLWYNDNWVLVKVRFAGEDGSDIQYVLQ